MIISDYILCTVNISEKYLLQNQKILITACNIVSNNRNNEHLPVFEILHLLGF